jgi:hypothetical protein
MSGFLLSGFLLSGFLPSTVQNVHEKLILKILYNNKNQGISGQSLYWLAAHTSKALPET